MNDSVDTGHGFLKNVHVTQIGLYELLALLEAGDRSPVQKAQVIFAAQAQSQDPANLASGPGDEDALHSLALPPAMNPGRLRICL